MFFRTEPQITNRSWETRDEIDHLNRIGEHNNGKPITAAMKAKLLTGALEGYSKRRNWGRLNKPKVIGHAQDLLQYYQGLAGN